MVDDEKTDVTGLGSNAKDETSSTASAAKTKGKAKAKSKAPARKKSSKAKKTSASSSAARSAVKAERRATYDDGSSSANQLPVDKVLAVLLVVAVLFGSYMLYKYYSGSGALKDSTSQTTVPTTQSGSPASTIAQTQSGRVKLEFYVMSKCPYGTQVLDAIAPVLKKVGGYVDFKVNYIADANADGTFSSLHGQTEVDEDLRELCVMKYYPEGYKFMDYITCRNANIQSTDWQSCATQNGMDAAKIVTCSQGDEGKQLLKTSIDASNTAGAQGSQTMFLNGQGYNGGRKDSDFMRALCAVMSTKPQACSEIPQPVKLDIVILSDARCKTCDTTGLEQKLLSVFPGAVFKKYDYSNADGKKVYSDAGIKYLPAILFDDKVKTDPSYGDVQNYLVQAGSLLNLNIGATFDPKAEICDNGADDNGDGLVDCKDPTCKEQMICRTEAPKRLDVFVMSMCPYGVAALNSMKEVLATFPGVSFGVHYIGSYDAQSGTFSSLHGANEVSEDLREVCAIRYYPDNNKYMDYIWCRNANIQDTNWQKCATDNGMDAAKIAACSQGDEGKQLLKDNMKLGNDLNVGASPTWLANNKYEFNAITAQDIKTNLCNHNSGLANCDKTLTGATGQAPAAGGCG